MHQNEPKLDISADSSESWITFSHILAKGKVWRPAHNMEAGSRVWRPSHPVYFPLWGSFGKTEARVCVSATTLGRGAAASSLFD